MKEEDIKDLMQTDAYQDCNHPLYNEVNRIVRQGFERLYPNDDRNEYPENYYVWHTMEDDKVRSSHADRHGQVFSWNNPPEGGHPGEDYGCRCQAEPYQTNDDSALIEKHLIRLQHEENILEHPYKDTKGIITAGVGKNVNDYNTFRSLEWQDKQGNKASEDQVKQNYNNIKNAPVGNYSAKTYKKYTNIKLSDNEMNQQVKEHLKNDLKYIRRHIDNFDNLPTEIRDVIIDIQYNTGNIKTFPKFLQAIREKDFNTMIKESHRLDISDGRNQWVKDKLQKIQHLNY